MATPTLVRQIDQVLDGKDVLGRPAPHTPQTLALRQRCTLDEAIDNALGLPGPRLNVSERTIFILKTATGIAQGVDDDDLYAGCRWLRAHPQDIATCITLRDASWRENDRLQRLWRQMDQASLKMMATYLEQVPHHAPPVRFTDGRFTLQEITHPLHLADTGAAFCNGMSTGYTKRLPNIEYWMQIKRMRRRIFTLNHDGDPCAVFILAGTLILEYEERDSPYGMNGALFKALDTLARSGTPVRFPEPRRKDARNTPLPITFLYEIHRAFNGDIEGLPPLPRIVTPTLAIDRVALHLAFQSFVTQVPDSTPPERERIARKIGEHMLANKVTIPDEEMSKGVRWFANNRHAIAGPTSLAAACALEKELPSKQPPPATPAVTVFERGDLRLQMFSTRKAVSETDEPTFQHDAHTEGADHHDNQFTRFFLLTHREAVIVTFEVDNAVIRQMRAYGQPDETYEAIDLVAPAVEGLTGFLKPVAGTYWPIK